MSGQPLVRAFLTFLTLSAFASFSLGEDAKEPASISQWKAQLLSWKSDLRVEPTAEEQAAHDGAVEKFAAITDPLAATPLGELLDAEDYIGIKVHLIPCLGKIPGTPAAKVLTKVCAQERSPVLYLAAAKTMSESEYKSLAIPYFVKYLEQPPLRDRLAYILPKTGLTEYDEDGVPQRDLFEALVKNLVTKDIWWMPGPGFRAKVNGQKIFDHDAGITRDTSTTKGKRLHEKSDPLVKNFVEEATPTIEEEGIKQVLITWTGEDFGFDPDAWRKWWTEREKNAKKSAEGGKKKVAAGKVASPLWTKTIAEWKSHLRVYPQEGERAAHEEALAKLAALRDPAALPALEKTLAAEKYAGIQLSLLRGLSGIGTKEAVGLLVKYACEPASEPLRQEAARLISELPNRDDAIPQFVRYLRAEKFQQHAIDALALTGLTNYRSGQLPHPQFFSALVDCLVTREYEYKEGEFPYDTGLTVRPNRTGGLQYGRASGTVKATVKVWKPKQQPQVLEMLKTYSKQDFGFEEARWKRWLAHEQQNTKAK